VFTTTDGNDGSLDNILARLIYTMHVRPGVGDTLESPSLQCSRVPVEFESTASDSPLHVITFTVIQCSIALFGSGLSTAAATVRRSLLGSGGVGVGGGAIGVGLEPVGDWHGLA
jgi:hypothetical protein